MTKWLNKVDVTQFEADVQDAYAAYRKAYEEAKAKRETFEGLLRTELETAYDVPAECIAINYNFGNLNIGIGEARPRPAAKPKLTLAQWLNQQPR